MKEKDGKLKAILNEEQYDNYQKIVKEKTAAVREAIMGD
jgi:pyruvate dehydrogenase complex dehydrogenase (E1) component